MKRCTQLVEWMNSVGFTKYDDCNRPAKFRAKYKTPEGEKKMDEFLCGIHCNSLKSWQKRYKKITGCDIKIDITQV